MFNDLTFTITKELDVLVLYCEELELSVEGTNVSELLGNFDIELQDQYRIYVMEADELFVCGLPDKTKEYMKKLKWLFERE